MRHISDYSLINGNFTWTIIFISKLLIVSRWIGNRYTSPQPDSDGVVDYNNVSVTYTNGDLSMSFSRPRIPDSVTQDVDFSSGCLYFIYPYSGGTYSSGSHQKHDRTPTVSTQRICVDLCNTTIGK